MHEDVLKLPKAFLIICAITLSLIVILLVISPSSEQIGCEEVGGKWVSTTGCTILTRGHSIPPETGEENFKDPLEKCIEYGGRPMFEEDIPTSARKWPLAGFIGCEFE